MEQSRLFVDYVTNISEDALLEEFRYKNMEGKDYTNPRAGSILHCMNHSTFHRGQIITMLRNAGFTDLSSTDYITYIRGE